MQRIRTEVQARVRVQHVHRDAEYAAQQLDELKVLVEKVHMLHLHSWLYVVSHSLSAEHVRDEGKWVDIDEAR